MCKPTTKMLVPKLRFPEFRGAREWEEAQLGQLGELVSGLTYSPEDIREKGLLVLRSSNVKNGKIALEDCVYVKPEIKGANLSKPNDILICVRNGSIALIGKNALIPHGMPLSTHGAFMTVFRASSAEFIFQLFQTDAYKRQVAGDLGATINSINGRQFIKYNFFVPSPPEQQKIADCLSSIDELIALHTQKHDALKDHKKGLMQQLFPAEGETVPKLRFPEFLDAGNWDEMAIGTVCKTYSGGTPQTSKKLFYGGSIPFIRSAEIDKEYTELFLTKEGLENSASKLVKKGDVLIALYGANSGEVALARQEGAINQAVLCLKSQSSNSFIYQFLLLKKNWIIAKYIQGGQGNLSGEIIKSIGLLFPKPEEQQKIADCLSSIDDLITVQAQKIDALKAHKKGLIHQLFPAMDEVGT
jgi:type I restriction enzyme, S subunit